MLVSYYFDSGRRKHSIMHSETKLLMYINTFRSSNFPFANELTVVEHSIPTQFNWQHSLYEMKFLAQVRHVLHSSKLPNLLCTVRKCSKTK